MIAPIHEIPLADSAVLGVLVAGNNFWLSQPMECPGCHTMHAFFVMRPECVSAEGPRRHSTLCVHCDADLQHTEKK
jgi:hypothetical protein